MFNKSFTLASVVSLTGAVVWMTSTAACGGDETATPGTTTSSSGSAGDGGSSSGETSSSGMASSSSGASSSTSSSGLVDPKTVDGVDVVFGKCDPFAKCDGSIEGSWKIVSGCLSDDTFDSYREVCKELMEHDVIIKAKGTVDATKTSVKQVTSIFLSAKLDLPKSCAQFPGVNGCAGIPGLLTGPFVPGGKKFDHMECTEDGDLCKCAGDVKVDETTTDDYQTDGTGLLTTKSNRTYEYCGKSDKITYRETTKDNKTFNMFLTIGK